MRVIVQVPMKGRSDRVPGKNLREVAGKPLFAHLLDRFERYCPADWRVVIDTDSDGIESAVRERYGDAFAIHRRQPWYASDAANGNHLLVQFAHSWHDADCYVQAFATAPMLRVESIECLVADLMRCPEAMSATHVVEETGWFWFDGQPINYDPDRPAGLPRSQDASVLRETTGAYAVRREALLETCCRLPSPCRLVPLGHDEGLDVDSMVNFNDLEKELVS